MEALALALQRSVSCHDWMRYRENGVQEWLSHSNKKKREYLTLELRGQQIIKKAFMNSCVLTFPIHFIERQHPPNSFKFAITKQVKGRPNMDMQKCLIQREAFWTFKLQTVEPARLIAAIENSTFL